MPTTQIGGGSACPAPLTRRRRVLPPPPLPPPLKILFAVLPCCLQGTPHCTICDTSSDKPLSKLSRECRDEWVVLEGPHGQEPCHRRCVVARKLEQERHKRERCSYERAKQLVYPLPTSHLDKCSLHRVGSGQEWADSGEHAPPTRCPCAVSARFAPQPRLTTCLLPVTVHACEVSS